jgi:hypothetical protein
MKTFVISFMLFLAALASAQTNNSQITTHRWKPLIMNDKEKIWYDASLVDSIKGDRFNMWLLQMHQPPLEFDNIKGEVYRTKTLYTINLTTVKYGIMKAVYYDVNNKELSNFDYDIANVPDNIKYTYPVMENSPIYALIKEIFGKQSESK